jgi:hypothetical protein
MSASIENDQIVVAYPMTMLVWKRTA